MVVPAPEKSAGPQQADVFESRGIAGASMSREARDKLAWTAQETANDLVPYSECQVHPANHAKRHIGQRISQTQLMADYGVVYDSLQRDFCPGWHGSI